MFCSSTLHTYANNTSRNAYIYVGIQHLHVRRNDFSTNLRRGTIDNVALVDGTTEKQFPSGDRTDCYTNLINTWYRLRPVSVSREQSLMESLCHSALRASYTKITTGGRNVLVILYHVFFLSKIRSIVNLLTLLLLLVELFT